MYKKTLEAKRLYEGLLPDFESYGNLAWRDTVLAGMPNFFLRYDARFAPQDHLLMLDYPLLIGLDATLAGIDRIYEYLRRTRLEQTFLAMFPKHYVCQVLERYHPSHEEMLFNLCGVLLNNALGHMLIEKPLGELGFSAGELEQSSATLQRLSKHELERLLRVNLRGLTDGSPLGSRELYDYLSQYLPDTAVEMRWAAEINCPGRVFLL